MKMLGHNAQHLVPAVKHGSGVIIWTWCFRMGEKNEAVAIIESPDCILKRAVHKQGRVL